MAILFTLGLAVLVLSFWSFASANSFNVTIHEDENKLRCDGAREKPTWWKDGQVINTTLDKYDEGTDDSSFYCLNFTFTTDDEGSYSCSNESNSVNSNKRDLIVDPQITGSSFNATFNDSGGIIIPCGIKIGSVTRHNEGLRVVKFWGDNIEASKFSGDFKEEGESYSVFFVADSSQYESLSNSDTYTCRIYRGSGTKEVRNEITLKVPPKVTIHRDDDDDGPLLSGQSLNVFCNASHPDENSSNNVIKSWRKDDKILTNDSKLVITQLSSKDSGVYTCSASFGGLKYSKSFNLTVEDLSSSSTTESSPTTGLSSSESIMSSISTASSQSTETPSPTSGSNDGKGLENSMMYAIIIIALLIIVMVLLAVMTLCYLIHCCIKRKKQNESESSSGTVDVELQVNQSQDSFRPALNPSVTSSANDRLTIASSSCCESCRCTPSLAPSSINPNQSDQYSLGHNPNHMMRFVSNNPSHCPSTATCTCSCTRSNNVVPPNFTRPPVHCHHPYPHPPLPDHAVIFKQANPSISNDSGCSVYYPPSETGTSRGYPDTRTVCSHCSKSFKTSIDSGYHPMRYSSGLPGYSSNNEGTVC